MPRDPPCERGTTIEKSNVAWSTRVGSPTLKELDSPLITLYTLLRYIDRNYVRTERHKRSLVFGMLSRFHGIGSFHDRSLSRPRFKLYLSTVHRATFADEAKVFALVNDHARLPHAHHF